jgi:hypothetical protein
MTEKIIMSTQDAKVIGHVSHQVDASQKHSKVVGFNTQVAKEAIRLTRAAQKAQKREKAIKAVRDASNLMRLKSLRKGELTYKPFSCLG